MMKAIWFRGEGIQLRRMITRTEREVRKAVCAQKLV
jgi:hypothetical protein